MGWFSSACSFAGSAVSSVANSIGSAVSSAASSVGRAASSAWNTAKEYAGKAIDVMADQAEKFVGGVKKVWEGVKPYVGVIRAGIKQAATWTAAAGMPWLSGALLALDMGIGALTAFEKSPIAKKINDAINWSIEIAKRWQGKKDRKNENEYKDERLAPEELEEARRHQDNLRFAEREVIPKEQRLQLELISAISDFEIANTDLKNALDGVPENFEHYLRLRATQKLMNMSEKKFRSAKTMDELSSDDLFLIRIASDLTKPKPELSNSAAERLNRLLKDRHGKILTTFVYEEMVASWVKRSKDLGIKWKSANELHGKSILRLKQLELAEKVQNELDPNEKVQLIELRVSVPKNKAALDSLAEEQRDIERYANATEGFLQILEKTGEEMEAEDRDYLKDDAVTIGRLMIDLAQNYKPFKNLDGENQSLINDYSNIFKKESNARMIDILEVTA